jgi:DNA modification methylase
MILNKIHLGDNREILKSLPSESVHTCVTSPPYFGLRDYGMDAQIGLEATPEGFVQELVSLFRELKRILRNDGTLWLNLGDSYASGPKNRTLEQATASSTMAGTLAGQSTCLKQHNKITGGLKAKDLIGIPWRVAFALQADGWYLRQDIIWHKPNPIPESVTDRCTKSHEYIFLLSKSDRYYFDSEAIKEPVAASTISRLSQSIETQAGSIRVPGKTNGTMKAVGSGDVRNKRSIWTVTTKPFKGAHFATYPEDLIVPCILAGAPEDGIVLDPFMGAGTTAVAALKQNRNYIGCELNPAYLAIAQARIQDAEKLKREQESQLDLFAPSIEPASSDAGGDRGESEQGAQLLKS